MSTILKALQRVEGEKGSGGPAPGLREGVVAEGEPPSRDRRPLWRIGLISVFVLILLGFFLWRLIPTDGGAPPSAEAPPAMAAAPERPSAPPPRLERRTAPRPQTAVPRRAPLAEPPPVSPRARAVAPQPPPASIEGPAPRVQVAETPPLPAAEPPAMEAAAPPERTPAAPAPPPQFERPEPWARIVEVPPPDAKPPAPAPKPQSRPPPRPPEPVAARAPPPPPPAPVVAKPPPPAPVAKVRPPAITVKKTIWHPTPERRVAQIEVEGHEGPIQLHEGDAVGTLVVAEIKPSEVIFLHRGEELHRRVGGKR